MPLSSDMTRPRELCMRNFPRFTVGFFATAAGLLFSVRSTAAQQAPMFPNAPITFDGKGITVYGTDSISRLTFRFRVQELFTGTTKSESDFSLARTQLMIRRMRLRMEGVVFVHGASTHAACSGTGSICNRR